MMGLTLNAMTATWIVSALAIAGVILRPFSWPEAIWAVLGAALLVVLRLIGPDVAWAGIVKGTDVYLFLTGMMLLAETARREGLFDWLAAGATRLAAGSPRRLFLLVYLVGTIVTIFMSNDATAVVLTPAVAAAVKTAKVRDPFPYLVICAFIANAASFVLPISNPANLVIFANHMPPLLHWLPRFALASALSIVATYVVLSLTQKQTLDKDRVADAIAIPALTAAGRLAAAGIGLTAIVLLVSSSLDWRLGMPTAVCGLLTVIAVLLRTRSSPLPMLKDISWGVLPLVAGLFVLVEALGQTGLIHTIGQSLQDLAHRSAAGAAWGAGAAVAFGSNLMNNLPAGLVAGTAVQVGGIPDRVTSAVLVGVDLGPNLSVTGSLATILWLSALRREGIHVSAWAFLRLGILVMPPALLLALAGLFVG
jgi:arsenical pump membrane protein